jgi:predicted nucleotidyltransferase
MNDQTNKIRIKAVSRVLGHLKEKVVFVGGATISLYPTLVSIDSRPTDDVDVIVEILNYRGRVELEEKLRAIGFVNDQQVICRWHIEKIIVDIMPTDDSSIGFKNIWYPQGFKHAVDYVIDETCTVKILRAPYFIATKLEAFKTRGKGNGVQSHDFEDIVYVLENRQTIWDEINNADADVKKYLQIEFMKLSNHPHIIEWIDCNVERLSPPATYYIMEQIRRTSSR